MTDILFPSVSDATTLALVSAENHLPLSVGYKCKILPSNFSSDINWRQEIRNLLFTLIVVSRLTISKIFPMLHCT